MKYCGKFKYFAIISLAILAIGLILGLTIGPNTGIDFSGGTIFTIDVGEDFDSSVIDAALKANGINDAVIVKSGTTSDQKTQAVIRLKPFGEDEQENATRQAVLEEVQKTYTGAKVGGVDRVGAVASRDLMRNAFLSVIIASALILLYVWFRFELLQGVAAVVMLMHDVLVMYAFTIILRVPINSSFIAAMLTIVGYSINNTIVIFDRLRENNKIYASRSGMKREDIVDMSISGSMTRTINTSITTLLTIVCVYIFGVTSIKEFALPIIIGLVAGTYSSVFLAAPFWNYLHDKTAKTAKDGKKN